MAPAGTAKVATGKPEIQQAEKPAITNRDTGIQSLFIMKLNRLKCGHRGRTQLSEGFCAKRYFSDCIELTGCFLAHNTLVSTLEPSTSQDHASDTAPRLPYRCLHKAGCNGKVCHPSPRPFPRPPPPHGIAVAL